MPVGKFYDQAIGPGQRKHKATAPSSARKPTYTPASQPTTNKSTQRDSYRVNLPSKITRSYRDLRDGLYLIVWLLDKVTVEYADGPEQRVGVALRGTPIADEKIAKHFNCDVKTIRSWRTNAQALDLIRTCRAPHGYKYAVVGTFKWPKKPPNPHLPEWAKGK
jgi:hypothetical protein